jgi:hypothetical protein
MFGHCELIKLFIEVNSKIKGNRTISAVTRSMERIRGLLHHEHERNLIDRAPEYYTMGVVCAGDH